MVERLVKYYIDRLDKAIEVYQSGYAPLILVSDGVGQEGVDESISMANYLTQHDIPLSRIIKDGQGNNTRATARNTFRYLQENHLNSVILVSQYYYIQRSKLAFKQAGIKIISPAAATHMNSNDLHSIMREMIGYPSYHLRFK